MSSFSHQKVEDGVSVFKYFSPPEIVRNLAPGEISDDEVSVIGDKGVLLLYQGSNRFYDQLIDLPQFSSPDDWLRILSEREIALGPQIANFNLFLPEKTSALIDLLPFPVSRPRPQMVLEMQTKKIKNIIFGEDLLEASNTKNRFDSSVWNYLESHLTEFGSIMVFNHFLISAGLDSISYQIRPSKLTSQGGDLVRENFGTGFIEQKNSEIVDHLFEPILISDNVNPGSAHRNQGRLVVWKNQNPVANLHLLIIGNSFSGTGFQKINITHWASKYFAKTTFLHSNSYPIEVKSEISPDLILFQTNDRFLRLIPNDFRSLAQLIS